MEREKKNPLSYLFGKTWKYSRGNRRNVILYILMLIASECVNTFWSPVVMANIMNVVTREGVRRENLSKLLFLLSLLIVRTVLSWGFHGPARVIEQLNAFRSRRNYWQYLLEGVMNLPLEWHTEHHSGDTIDKMNKGTGALFDFSGDSFEIIKPLVLLVGSLSMIVYFSPISVVIVAVMMALGAWVTVAFDATLGPQYRQLNRFDNKISERIFDTVSNISTVIILRVEKLVFETIMRKVDEPFDLFKRNAILNEWKWFWTSVCANLMVVFVLGFYLYQHLGTSAGVLVGNVYLLLNYLNKVGELFYQFTSLYGGTIRRKYRVMNAEELSKEFQPSTFANHVLPKVWSELSIRNLNFSYGGGEGDPHLDDVSTRIQHGEHIAIVGGSGSSKTTFLMLMRDLYHPQSLTLSVDSVEIPHGFEGISRAISLVPQDPEILATTIRENITLGAEYDERLVRHYTDMACFTDVVDSLPKGFDSSVKEKGVNLSGGQVQRLALSRGLLACHGKDIVLLDEPTSSLDVVTEITVYRNILVAFRNKTVISTVHRLQLLPLFDRVCMFEKGRIVGSGTVQELLLSCPQFEALWNRQFVDPV